MRAMGKIGDRVRYNRSYNKYFGNGAGMCYAKVSPMRWDEDLG